MKNGFYHMLLRGDEFVMPLEVIDCDGRFVNVKWGAYYVEEPTNHYLLQDLFDGSVWINLDLVEFFYEVSGFLDNREDAPCRA